MHYEVFNLLNKWIKRRNWTFQSWEVQPSTIKTSRTIRSLVICKLRVPCQKSDSCRDPCQFPRGRGNRTSFSHRALTRQVHLWLIAHIYLQYSSSTFDRVVICKPKSYQPYPWSSGCGRPRLRYGNTGTVCVCYRGVWFLQQRESLRRPRHQRRASRLSSSWNVTNCRSICRNKSLGQHSYFIIILI